MSEYFIFPIILLIFCWFVRFIYGAPWKPKILDKYCKSVGIFEGTSYKLLYGDAKEHKKLMVLNHVILPRVNPMWHRTIQKYGKCSLKINLLGSVAETISISVYERAREH